MLLAVIGLLALFVATVMHFYSRSSNLPPGPWGLPLVGVLPWMEWARKERSYLQWARQYGSIFSLSELGRTTVVLTDPEMIRDAFSRTATASRVPFSGLEEVLYSKYGLIFSNGDLWNRSRRFTLHHLRNLGMGRSKLEAVIQGQISQFLDEILAPAVGKPIDFSNDLKIAVANIIWGTVSSENFSIRDTRALSVIKEFDSFGDHVLVVFLAMMFPWIRHLPGNLTGLSNLSKMIEDLMDVLFRPAIAEHEKTFNMNDEPRDLIDALLQERAKDPKLVTEKHILRSILDLFAAGYDTTSTTVMWTFCLLAKYPEEQDKLRKELRQVLGDRRPTLADRPRMPFTEATVMEVQRMANVAPVGVEHMIAEPIQLGGYTVPRGARLTSLLAAVHMDPKYFQDPEVFRPGRFLAADGKLKPDKSLMPFSVGKRACLGEALARSELFLFTTCVLQKYRLRFSEGFQHDLSVIETKMFIRELTPFQLVMEEVPVAE